MILSALKLACRMANPSRGLPHFICIPTLAFESMARRYKVVVTGESS